MSFLFQKNISKFASSESVFAKPLISNHSSYLHDHQPDEFVQNKSNENNSNNNFYSPNSGANQGNQTRNNHRSRNKENNNVKN